MGTAVLACFNICFDCEQASKSSDSDEAAMDKMEKDMQSVLKQLQGSRYESQ